MESNNLLTTFLFGLVLTFVVWKYSIICYKSEIVPLSMRNSGIMLKGLNAKRFAVFFMVIASILTIVLIRYLYLMIFDPIQLS